MNRAFTNILSNNVEGTASFYEDLLGMKRAGDFGWFIVLSHDEMPTFEMGVLDRDHETVPDGFSSGSTGNILTFVVNDLEEVHARAVSMQTDIIQEPTDLPYGQRRLMLRDPSGSVVDISSPIR
ncbi:glyoxalase [Sulfitobacter sp. M57]|uniref:VOC family protein n=1 Tax=unclassified Sulfitobacter TaxID=196795 RepID=UPI0023E0956D|nr:MULTISPECIES: VOC family protein [unclassified Sulfitobacter]MDF3415453.1 glyoxalase [Sulfitobacter sp. KE5]MDF3422934.1 glyoxalase [Sulfitobacter sp. KE43]MDF3433999.1 glyoxalase [Sulfitobacter sp. KE42]MDF3459968.1 glyoxalase [Sulfitobacter sp. S74]MDF3463538.1 glyoxalase [Sulfitobacter sp. Ks18]